MSHPIFLHFMSNGDVWTSNDVTFTPSGTILATHKVNSGAATQKIGTITATAGAVTAVSGATGKNPNKEIS